MEKRYKPITKIESGYLPRIPIFSFKGLEWLYGYTSEFTNIDWGIPKEATVWGMPEGKISIWSGPSGVGKSRLAISVAQDLVRCGGYKILFIHTEATESDLVSWIKDKEDMDLFISSNANSLPDIIEDIKEVKPKVVFIDSVNRVREFETGNKREADSLMDGLKPVAENLNCHIILLCQVNQDGSTKGGTSLPHLVDIALEVIPGENQNFFNVKIGCKHRYGRADKDVVKYEHTDKGVYEISQPHATDELWHITKGFFNKKEYLNFIGGNRPTDPIESKVEPLAIQESKVDQNVWQIVAPTKKNGWDSPLGWGLVACNIIIHRDITIDYIRTWDFNTAANSPAGRRIEEFIQRNNNLVSNEDAISFGGKIGHEILDGEFHLAEVDRNTWWNAFKSVFGR